jgi:F-type H+-transporting ATPase subunit delta
VSDSSPVSGVSGRYATALFELADESGQLDAVERQLGILAQALGDSEDLRRLVASPIYSRDEQGKAMAALCDAMDVGAPTKNLVGLMAAKRRLFALGDVIRDFNALLANKRGVLAAEVRSAKPLSDDQRAALARTLGDVTGSEIKLDEFVDETLIGGLVVKVGSRMIDTTVRARLNQLQTAMKEAGI